MTTRLLVAVHPGLRHTPALERAGELAGRCDADVLVYSAMYDEHFAGSRFSDKAEMRKTRESMVKTEQRRLERVRRDLQEHAKNVSVEVEWRHPASQGIVDAAMRFGADLIIVSSTQHSAVGRWLLTNTDWHVLRLAPIPVLLAHHRPFQPYKTVMVAVDPTHEHDEPAALDHRLVERGRWFSELFDGEVFLGHAYPSASTVIPADYIPPRELIDAWRVTHVRAVEKLAEEYGIAESRLRFLDEHPRRAIPDLARELAADLVVIGVISRSLLTELLIGRTAEHVLDHLECDVLSVAAARPRASG